MTGNAQVKAIEAEGLAVIDFITGRPQRGGMKAVAVSIAVLALAENTGALALDHSPEQVRHVRTLMLGNLREAVSSLERQLERSR